MVPPPTRRRQAVTLLEVLIATLVLASLGMAIYESAISSTRGVTTDRLTEVTRGLCADLLERFCQPYTDVPALFPRDGKPARLRTFTVDETFTLVGVPEKEAPGLKAVLAAGKVEGFTLVWKPRIDHGRGTTASALRLDALWVSPLVAGDSPGGRVEVFRVFAARGVVGE